MLYINVNASLNQAKSIWAIDICELRPSRRVFDFYGTLYERFIKFISPLQEILCTNSKCKKNI